MSTSVYSTPENVPRLSNASVVRNQQFPRKRCHRRRCWWCMRHPRAFQTHAIHLKLNHRVRSKNYQNSTPAWKWGLTDSELVASLERRSFRIYPASNFWKTQIFSKAWRWVQNLESYQRQSLLYIVVFGLPRTLLVSFCMLFRVALRSLLQKDCLTGLSWFQGLVQSCVIRLKNLQIQQI